MAALFIALMTAEQAHEDSQSNVTHRYRRSFLTLRVGMQPPTLSVDPLV